MPGARAALLAGKILRGGMGTGMPNWGTILTDEAVSALVDYLWTFPFPGHPDVGVSVSAYFSSR
jgi:mono/diheme cytochrome c family protein